jgi:hypothetical protein
LAAAPPIAFDAASEPLAISVNLYQPFPATVALHLASLFNYPRFLAKRDELAGTALCRFLICLSAAK